ncbi:MAG: type II toxin-antitoxin system VapC family toxin [Thiobacillaceae bacterium]
MLDTRIFVWWLASDRKLPKAAEPIILDPANEIHVSAGSVWEITVKSGLGQIQVDPALVVAAIAESGFQELPVTSRHAIEVATLPKHHRDPFDRLLVAQSRIEPMHLLTHDRQLAAYGSTVLIV